MNKTYLTDKPIGHIWCRNGNRVNYEQLNAAADSAAKKMESNKYAQLNRRAEKMSRNRFISACNKNKNQYVTVWFVSLFLVGTACAIYMLKTGR